MGAVTVETGGGLVSVNLFTGDHREPVLVRTVQRQHAETPAIELA